MCLKHRDIRNIVFQIEMPDQMQIFKDLSEKWPHGS